MIRGNVLFLILLAVALFAALSYAVTQSSRSGGNDISKENIRLAFAEVQQFETSIISAIQRLRLSNGCTLNQISFDNDVQSYLNSNAPDDNSCHIFHPSGGNIAYRDPPEVIFPDAAADFWRTTYSFNGDVHLENVGTTNSELVMGFELRSQEICDTINDTLHNDTSIPSVNYCFVEYNGAFDRGHAGCLGTVVWNVGGWRSGCVTGNSQYYYFTALVER